MEDSGSAPTTATPDPATCPICHGAFTRDVGGWLGTFTCKRCGTFSDFGGMTREHRTFPMTAAGLIGPIDILRRC